MFPIRQVSTVAVFVFTISCSSSWADSVEAPALTEERLAELGGSSYVPPALRNNPGKSYYHVERAEAYSKKQKHQEALKEYNEAIRLGDSGAARFGIAHELSSLGRHQEAVREFRAAIQSNAPSSDSTYDDDPAFREANTIPWLINCLKLLGAIVAAVLTTVLIVKAKAVLQATGIVLLILTAQAEQTDDFYTICRFGICFVTAYTTYRLWKTGKLGWAWIYGAIAVLFNPIVRTQLEEETWQALSVATAVVMFVSILALNRLKVKQVASSESGGIAPPPANDTALPRSAKILTIRGAAYEYMSHANWTPQNAAQDSVARHRPKIAEGATNER